MGIFDGVLIAVAMVSGAVASVAGFGIGSILTPLLALELGTKVAVAAISIPHFLATFFRFWLIRRHVNRKVFWNFGFMSAAGGLAGALLHARFESRVLTLIFSLLLLFAGALGFAGLAQKLRFRGPAAWVAGALSGAFGGLVGNQGGIRSGALLGFGLSKEEIVATGTAVGVAVDIARMPVYFWSEQGELLSAAWLIVFATLGVLAGTVLGIKLLRGLSERLFRRLLGSLLFLLGIYMGLKALGA